jgi:riboflavin kinase/FMN adenylyltransferase
MSMIVTNRLDKLQTIAPCAVALGAFDGLHRGHRVLIDTLLSESARHGLCSMVFTFDPHPDTVLHPDRPFPLLMTKEEKERALDALDVGVLHYQVFDETFHTMEPEAFIDFIISHLSLRVIVAGYNYRFGYRGKGNADTLTACCGDRGIDAIIIPPVIIDGITVSSTRIREALADGDIILANHMLGYEYEIQGQIAAGRGRGRTLGYPTANLSMDEPGKMLPAGGVYVTKVSWEGETHYGITNVGINPTFETDGDVRIETHIPGWSGELYGKKMRLCFLHRLREERSFTSGEALTAQLRDDMRAFEKLVYKKKDM